MLLPAACAFVASSAITGRAFGEVSFALSWHGTRSPACVTEPALREAVARKLGRNPFAELERAQIHIEGEESPAGSDRFRARVTQTDQRGVVLGSRELEPQACASLLRAATLVVALIIDPDGSGGRGEGERRDEEGRPSDGRSDADEPAPADERRPPLPAPPPSSAPSGAPEPSRRRPPTVAARSLPRFDLSLGVGAGVTAGVLPSTGATLFIPARLSVGRSRWSFDWRGGYALPQTLRDGLVTGEFAALEQQLRGCFAFVRWANATFDTCGGFVWGGVIPKTRGVQLGNDSWRVIAGPVGALAFQLNRRGTAARLDLGIALPSREYTFSYRSVSGERKALYSTDDVVFSASLSVLRTIF